MSNDSRAPTELDLYGDVFRCESCSKLADVHGVAAFAARGPEQTIPVSHFGDISRSLLWLILNNPKGDRLDPAVCTSPISFGAGSRAELSTASIMSVKTHFDRYFQHGSRANKFFKPWIELLDGIELEGQTLKFSEGRICAVDLIKCPTRRGWMGYVMTPEGKEVWDNCLRHEQRNRFLVRQIDLHSPRILLFAGTQGCVGRNWRGSADKSLNSLVLGWGSPLIKRVWTLDDRHRLSIGLASQRVLDKMNPQVISFERRRLQKVLDTWVTRSSVAS